MAKVKTKEKSTAQKGGGIIESAVNAVEELGEAATSLKDSWSHVQKARSKGRAATKAVARSGKKAWSATKSGTKKVTHAAGRMLPGKKKKSKK